jgi:hypothetical protein
MKQINLDIRIHAPRETVWAAIVSPEHYNRWTRVFTETSHFEGGWNKGDAIRFLAINADGAKEGMVSEIAESDFPAYISIRHLGYIMNGVEDTTSEAIKAWAPAYENYTLQEAGPDATRFAVQNDVTDDYYDMFMDLWPKALQALKEVAEAMQAEK